MIELFLWIAGFLIVGLCCLSYSLATWKDYWKQATENLLKEKKNEKKIVPKKDETVEDYLRRQSK